MTDVVAAKVALYNYTLNSNTFGEFEKYLGGAFVNGNGVVGVAEE